MRRSWGAGPPGVVGRAGIRVKPVGFHCEVLLIRMVRMRIQRGLLATASGALVPWVRMTEAVGVGATVGEVLPVRREWEIPPPAARPKGDAAGA